MKATMTIFVCVLAVGLAAAQNLEIIQNTRTTMNAVRDQQAAASNAALGIADKAPSAASAAHAPAKSGGTAAVPASSSSTKTSKMATSKKGTSKMATSKASPGKAAKVAGKSARPKGEPAAPKDQAPMTAKAAGNSASGSGAAENAAGDEKAEADAKWNPGGKRDPFVSPVVSHVGNPSCSAGKKCLEIGSINLRGIVRAESGFIAVVSNSLNKAYFLRENDPVFNGYVVKITGDSIVFQETLQDRLGRTFTREVVKKIPTPAV